jgi:hypothetical protein
MAWTWQYETAGESALAGTSEPFPSQSDAESWLGEQWRDLAEQGVTAVTLFEDARVVYGPMSLSAG